MVPEVNMSPDELRDAFKNWRSMDLMRLVPQLINYARGLEEELATSKGQSAPAEVPVPLVGQDELWGPDVVNFTKKAKAKAKVKGSAR